MLSVNLCVWHDGYDAVYLVVSLWQPRLVFIKVFECFVVCNSVTGGELFEDIVAREFYSEADARYNLLPVNEFFL